MFTCQLPVDGREVVNANSVTASICVKAKTQNISTAWNPGIGYDITCAAVIGSARPKTVNFADYFVGRKF